MSFFFDNDAPVDPPSKRLHTENHFSLTERPQRANESDSESDAEEKPVTALSGGGVGVKLLESMQRRPKAKENAETFSRKMRVVESYVPLSVGGFMESASETVDDSLHVRVGSVMCLRCPRAVLSGDGEGALSTSKEHAKPPGVLFVKETDLSDEERLYGKSVTADMTKEIFEVGRVDRVSNSLEAIFIDGARQKLKFSAVRPAGFVERELFRKWKSDPSARPVRIIRAENPTTECSTGANASAAAEDKSPQPKDNSPPAKEKWWVVPQLVVRVVEESAEEMCGKKFIVRAVFRKERRIRLEPLRPGDLCDVFGCEALETVLPKTGERGMIVWGAMRGELVTVAARHRNANGELAAVRVTSMRTGSEFTVEPHELCLLEVVKRGK